MRYDLATNWVQPGGGTIAWTEPFQTHGDNTVSVIITSFVGLLDTANGASVTLWLSDDLENWYQHATAVLTPATVPQNRMTTLTGIASPYARLRFKTSADAVCLNVAVNTVQI